jgi:hypothetical protein
MSSRSFTGKEFHVRVNHDADEFAESHFWFPTENFFLLFEGFTGLGGLLPPDADNVVVLHELLPIKIGASEGGFNKLNPRCGFRR